MILAFSPNPMYQALGVTMNSCLENVARSLTTGLEGDTSQNQYYKSPSQPYIESILIGAAVRLKNGSKVPDTVLLSDSYSKKHLIIAVEIGWIKTVEKLFADAKRPINGTRKAINAVILKIYETDPHTGNKFPQTGKKERDLIVQGSLFKRHFGCE